MQLRKVLQSNPAALIAKPERPITDGAVRFDGLKALLLVIRGIMLAERIAAARAEAERGRRRLWLRPINVGGHVQRPDSLFCAQSEPMPDDLADQAVKTTREHPMMNAGKTGGAIDSSEVVLRCEYSRQGSPFLALWQFIIRLFENRKENAIDRFAEKNGRLMSDSLERDIDHYLRRQPQL